MHTYPQIRLLLTSKGVHEIEVLHLPGERLKAWELCQQLLPRIRELDAETPVTNGFNRS
jgi:hypothetical protein